VLIVACPTLGRRLLSRFAKDAAILVTTDISHMKAFPLKSTEQKKNVFLFHKKKAPPSL